MTYLYHMTVHDILKNPDFNNSSISKHVFGAERIISDKLNCNRNKKWKDADTEAVKTYIEKKYKIILDR